MCQLKVLILFLIQLILCKSETCEQATKIDITVYRRVDSDSEPLIIKNQIYHYDDIFRLLIANQTIPKLCKDFVLIENELSVLQIINSSVDTILPGALNITPTLALFKLSLNPITTIEKNVFNDVKVKEIDLSHNKISNIHPEAFDNNTYLEIVILNHNHLKEIDPNWFQNSYNVYKLSIGYNEAKLVPANAFKNLSKKRGLKLKLSANMINEIDAAAFSSHSVIDLLEINGNKLTALPESLFINNTVKKLQVNTNQLKCFPESFYKSQVKILGFVDNNAFGCECLRKTKKFVEDNDVRVIYPSIICEDKTREIISIFSYNKTYDVPLLPANVDVEGTT